MIGKNTKPLILPLQSQLIQLSNSTYNENNFLSLQVDKADYSDQQSGLSSRNIFQFSFVFLTIKINDRATFLNNSLRLRYKNYSLNIPVQFKNGCTTNIMENRVISIRLMITYDNLVASFQDDFVSNIKRQISQSNLLNISTEFSNNHTIKKLKDNYTALQPERILLS